MVHKKNLSLLVIYTNGELAHIGCTLEVAKGRNFKLLWYNTCIFFFFFFCFQVFLLLQNFSVAISVSPHVCFILVLILISVFLR